jgi:hypothetical protein
VGCGTLKLLIWLIEKRDDPVDDIERKFGQALELFARDLPRSCMAARRELKNIAHV